MAVRVDWSKRLLALSGAATLVGLSLSTGKASASLEPAEEQYLPGRTLPEVDASTGELRFNQLQYVGTHNSYHIAPDGALVVLAELTDYRESPDWPSERLYRALDYTHPSLTTQLELGMRQFELDVHYDPEGGKFAQPGALQVLQASEIPSTVSYDRSGRMQLPGFKVFHGGTDVLSTCLTLRDCLEELKKWSETNSRHFPIVIQIEAKDGTKPALANAYTPPNEPPFDLIAWAALEAEIVDVIGEDKIVMPDEVQGEHRTFSHALKVSGWPTLNQMAGRFVFLLLNKKEETQSYVRSSPNLVHQLFFTSRALDDPSAGWFRIPDPEYPDVRRAVRNGQLTTVQADTHTMESRHNRTDRRDNAFESGAQFILTDYPIPDRRFSDYQVRFGSRRYVRCNPVTFESPCPF